MSTGRIIKLLFISLLLQFQITGLCAQSIGKLSKTDKNPVQTNYINTKDSTIRFETTNVYTVKSFAPDLFYYWYKSNVILKTAGAADGRILCGTYTCFYPNNNLKEKGQFATGLKNGIWLTWFMDGKVKELFTWKKGILCGKHIIYNENGNEVLVENYKKGKLETPTERKKLFSVFKKKNDSNKKVE